MVILHLNMPEDLYEHLKQRAAAKQHSLNAEVITLLEWAIEAVERRSGTTLDAIRRRRSFCSSELGAPDSTASLQGDRQR